MIWLKPQEAHGTQLKLLQNILTIVDKIGKTIDTTIKGAEKARISTVNAPVCKYLQTYGTLKTAQYGINIV